VAQAAAKLMMDGGMFRKLCKENPVMTRALKLLVFANMAVAMAWAAENPFIGNWKLDSSKSRMPDEMKVESKGGNTYSFDFGGGPETIVADGSDQPGGYGGTTLSVKADAPDTWIVARKKDGQLLIKATWKLSKDGDTLTDYFRGFDPAGPTLSMDYVYRRSGGGSGFAADWKSIKERMNSPFGLEVRAFERDGLTFILPVEHDTKSAKLDGKDYPDQDPNARPGSSCSIRQIDEHSLEMTDKAGGKITRTREIKLSSDGKTLTMIMPVTGQSEPDVLVFDRE
jgi:hypothetical protein